MLFYADRGVDWHKISGNKFDIMCHSKHFKNLIFIRFNPLTLLYQCLPRKYSDASKFYEKWIFNIENLKTDPSELYFEKASECRTTSRSRINLENDRNSGDKGKKSKPK